ncbi:MAG: NADase-type glycan-binding domain-containing protein [Treponema sp.]
MIFQCVKISDDSIEFIDFDLKESNQKNDVWNNVFSYKIENKGGINFLIIERGLFSKRFLYLSSDELIVLYDDKNKNPFFIGYNTLSCETTFLLTDVKSDSELNENGTVYSAGNLGNLNLEEPWAEGEVEYGIGTKLQIDSSSRIFVIFSGFVSYSRPELYSENSRPKLLRFYFTESDVFFIINLNDSPNPQCFILSDYAKGSVVVEILDVYKGTKYKDTCINCIMTSMIN